jgi:cyclophilin family peptidyl-prolyl cis-trans isomerase
MPASSRQDERSRGASACAAALAAALSAACGSGAGASTDAGAAALVDAAADAGAPAIERAAALRLAEQRRSAGEVTAADQQSRDPIVRRAAARALARIGGEAAQAGLLRALADEDEAVVAWGAYGLGASCKGHEKESVAAMVARSLSLGAVAAEEKAALDPRFAISRAIGRCAAAESEPTLVAWLAGPRPLATAAALALGDLASGGKRLREETLVALVNLAAGSASEPPLPEALFAAGRLENVPPSVVDRLREIATARLAEPGEARIFAVRALGRAGKEAAAELGRVLVSANDFTASERAEAARALRRLGPEGQRALADAVPALAPPSDPIAQTGLVGEGLAPLLVTLESLEEPGKARKLLRELAALPVAPGAPPALVRRIAWIRCSAAKLVVGEAWNDALLARCDPTAVPADAAGTKPGTAAATDAGAPDAGEAPRDGGAPAAARGGGSIGARAVIAVLDRAELRGPRLRAWLGYARGADVRARETALELLASHAEIDGAPAVLAEALESGEPGVVATAAEVIGKQPQRAGEDPAAKKPKKARRRKAPKDAPAQDAGALGASPAVVKALLAGLTHAAGDDDPEVLAALEDAVGALALKDAAPRLEELCRSPWPTLREHAQKALAMVSGGKPTCEAPPGGGEVPPELASLLGGAQTLRFDTDVGPLSVTLDPDAAPVAVTRVVELARAGYYDGIVVHRVVPGFVSQLGAPHGDGYGGPAGKRPLRCETSPRPFGALNIGVALAGRDTGSAQIFVTHSRTPHLDGQYAWLGTASGPWAALVDGDVVQKVTVGEGAPAPK